MKRLIPMILTVLLLFAGCTPAQAPDSADATQYPGLTEQQKTYLKCMELGRYLDDSNVLPLVSFPADATYENADYRLTLCAVYADYADKRLLVKVEPVSQAARDAFGLYNWNDLYQTEGELDEEIFHALAARMPAIKYPDDTDMIYWNSSDQEVTPQEETDARYFYFSNTTNVTEGILYFPIEYVNWKTGEYLAELKDISLKVDLTPAIQHPLVFDLNLPVDEEGLVLDTLTLGVVSTRITYHFSPKDRDTVPDTLNAHLKSLPMAWVDQNGKETDFDRFRVGLTDTKYNSPDDGEEGEGHGVGWPHDSTSLPIDQVASLTIDGVTYTPRA